LYGERPWRGQECESLVQWATRTRVEGLRLNGQGYLGGGLKGKGDRRRLAFRWDH
jgi:hypothetical protein